MQTRGRPLQSFDSNIFMVMFIDYDCSSKLCFEEKSNSVTFVIIFQTSLQLISSGVVMVSLAKFHVMQPLQKVPKNSSF